MTGPRGRRRHLRDHTDDPLVRAVRLLEVDPRRTVLAVLAGTAALGTAVGLAAVSAWLIARASQMPPVMHLTVAAVSVRALGIGRGVLRYVERLWSHDLALRGMATLRVRLYEQLAAGRAAPLMAVRRGDLLARVGTDVDAVGDVVVRGLLPAAVAALLGLGSVGLVGALLPAAGLALAGCLVLAGVLAPWWSLCAVRTAERESAAARARTAAVTMTLLDGAGELRVAGRVPVMLQELRRSDEDLAAGTDRGARGAAVAAAAGPLAVGLAVLACLALGIEATTAGRLSPVALAVVVLTPLAAFEATSLLPAAATQLLRSRQAARRVLALLDAAAPPCAQEQVRAQEKGAPARADAPLVLPVDVAPGRTALVARGLTCGWPGRRPVVSDLDLHLEPGRSIAVVGASGAGKTTLLLTLAGLLPPVAGTVQVDGVPVTTLPRAQAARLVAMTAEDAHVFDTSVLENLRVARGDVTAQDAHAALDAVGLGPWLAGLPAGLGTVVGTDAARVSGGERRRLLLARALLAPAPLLLLDEPTEHVDTGGALLLRGLLDGTLTPGRGVLVVTHRLGGVEAAHRVIRVGGPGGSVAT